MTAFTPAPDLPSRPVFVLTIDTEEEWDWTGTFPRAPFSTRNIAEIPAFQGVCAELGVLPTYLVDQAVADEADNVAVLGEFLNAGRCDVGAHLHPWCTPPIVEPIDERHSHAVNLPLALFKAKLRTLTDRLSAAFGRHPYSYRAGRWGVSGAHLEALADAGYRIDSSVRPFYSDTDFSYTRARTTPYWPSFDDPLEADPEQRAILEVPASSGYDRAPFERLQRLHETLATPPLSRLRLIGALWRLRLLRKVTVTPEGNDSADVCRCIDAALRRGDRVVNMFFHSSDLLPGATPYVRTAADKRRFIDCLRRCVEHVREVHDAEPLTLRQLGRRLTGTP